MQTVFENKTTLIQYYKITFHEYLTNFQLLLNCIEQRYTKPIDPSALVSSDFSKIVDIIGAHEEERLKHFFGDQDNPDPRDSQLSVFDRFILDSVHFAVMNQLIAQLRQECEVHKELISKIWEEELKTSQFTTDISVFLPHYLNHHNAIFFQDLVFPQQEQQSPLFSLHQDATSNTNSLIITNSVLENWLNVSGPNYKLILSTALAGIILATLAVKKPAELLVGVSSFLLGGLSVLLGQQFTVVGKKTLDPNRVFATESEIDNSELCLKNQTLCRTKINKERNFQE